MKRIVDVGIYLGLITVVLVGLSLWLQFVIGLDKELAHGLAFCTTVLLLRD